MNWNQRYAMERKRRRYRRYNYRKVNSPGPDNGGLPLTHPVVGEWLDQAAQDLLRPEFYVGQDSQGRHFCDLPSFGIAPIKDHLKYINQLREINRNPNSIVGVERATGFGDDKGNPEPRPEEQGINPGDHVALNLDVKHDSVDEYGAEKFIPAKHYYVNLEYAAPIWGGYHPRRGLDRNLYGDPHYKKTTVEETAEEFHQMPLRGRELSHEWASPVQRKTPEQLDQYGEQ